MALLSRVILENFGCFRSLDVPLSPLTALVGRNDAGKTTFLKSILAARGLAPGFYTDDIGSLLNMSRILWAGAAPDKDVCTVKLHGSGRLAPPPAPIARFELELAIHSSPDHKRHTGVMHDIRIAGGPGSSEMQKGLASTLRGIRLVRYSPDALRRPSPPAHGETIPELAEDGAGLATLLSVLAGAERERIAAIEEQFKKAVPSLDGFRILPTPEGHHRLVFKLAGNMGQIEAAQASDGALLFLGFLSLLYHPEPPSVLLIEEPETGVHPARLQNIVHLLRTLTIEDRARPAIQILMTTHSPYLLDAVEPHEALVFRRDQSGAASAIRMDQIPDIDERLSDYKLGELWTAYEEDRLHELARSR